MSGGITKIHELKTWPTYYRDIINKYKTWEHRIADRPFQRGDLLHLREWNPDTKRYTGHECLVKILGIYFGASHEMADQNILPDLKADYCIMSIEFIGFVQLSR